jgi:hypothetical protein
VCFLFVFVLFVFVLCRQCLWGVHSWLPFRFYLTCITTDQRISTYLITIGSNMCWHWTINFSGDWRWLYCYRSMIPQLFRQTAQWSVHWSWQLINSTSHLPDSSLIWYSIVYWSYNSFVRLPIGLMQIFLDIAKHEGEIQNEILQPNNLSTGSGLFVLFK